MNTVELNFTGHPGVSVPIGPVARGCPHRVADRRTPVRRPARTRSRGRARVGATLAAHRTGLRTVRDHLTRVANGRDSTPSVAGCERLAGSGRSAPRRRTARASAHGSVLADDEVTLVELPLDRLEPGPLDDREVHVRTGAREEVDPFLGQLLDAALEVHHLARVHAAPCESKASGSVRIGQPIPERSVPAEVVDRRHRSATRSGGVAPVRTATALDRSGRRLGARHEPLRAPAGVPLRRATPRCRDLPRTTHRHRTPTRASARPASRGRA